MFTDKQVNIGNTKWKKDTCHGERVEDMEEEEEGV